ncbi:NTP transferase domain-containing protein, partial [Sinorhizobium medicae]|uniref:NTP transferase domain-containing protein n=1 Tax=Sinorhizobium medicae TaxID=110321 RepID=UPI001F1DAE5A
MTGGPSDASSRPPAVILAGGRSSRMGHPKAEVILGGRSMLMRVIERLRPQVGETAVNLNSDPALVPATDLEILPDTLPGFLGPLAGVLAALRHAALNPTAARPVLPLPLAPPLHPPTPPTTNHTT